MRYVPQTDSPADNTAHVEIMMRTISYMGHLPSHLLAYVQYVSNRKKWYTSECVGLCRLEHLVVQTDSAKKIEE